MNEKELAPYVAKVLSKFDGVRPTKDGWDALCPCPDHNSISGRPGDHNPSVRITLGHDGRILVKCWIGCKLDQIRESAGISWSDLFCSPDYPVSVREESSGVVPTGGNTDLIHSAYESLLSTLHLSDLHQGELYQRGMSKELMDRGQYRSLRNFERGRAAKFVSEKLGNKILAVPGFTESEFGITLAGTSTGLLIPVRDAESRIQAIKIRRSGDPKYVYLTGTENRNSSGSPVHIPLGINGPAKTVRVTEGELKSDISFWLEGTPTIGIPGVTQWKKAFPVLRQLEATTIIIAFDAVDIYTKPPVFHEAKEFWRSLKDEGYEVELEDWYEQP